MPTEFNQRQYETNYTNIKTVVITVPVREEIWSNYDEFYGHFRRYNIKMLDNTIEACGLESIQRGYLFHGLYLPACFLTKLNKKREVHMKPPRTWLGIIIHVLIANYFVLEAKLYPNKWIGTSIISIAKKHDK